MLSLKRAFGRAQPRFATTSVKTPAFLFNSEIFKDKERGEEKAYFSKEDARLLKSLADKMKKQQDQDNEMSK